MKTAMSGLARRVVLPKLLLTKVTQDIQLAETTIPLPDGSNYHTRRWHDQTTQGVGSPTLEYIRYPIILLSSGEPWDEANAWIMSNLEDSLTINMETVLGIAEDLVAFCRFLEDKKLDWLDFPEFRLHRPTYRYSKYLRDCVDLGEIKASTAKRRMSRVISFYRDLLSRNLIKLDNEPWKKGEAYIVLSDFSRNKTVIKVNTTDINIKSAETKDPFDETITDEGRLRPLPPIEQKWLLEALAACAHPEHILAHLLALATGARIQTVLTIRLRHVINPASDSVLVKLPVGRGTGIDTKRGKRYTLHIPKWLYTLTQTYARSARAGHRRAKTDLGDDPDQYLFLTPTGNPLYTHRNDLFSQSGSRRHSKRGQTIRAYMNKYILPYIRKRYSSTFTYQFHDLRATFCMNLVDNYAVEMQKGICTYSQVLAIVACRMGHSKIETTERYLNYRDRIALAHAAQEGWENQLSELVEKVMATLN